MTKYLKTYNPAGAMVVLGDRSDIEPRSIFTLHGEEWYAITGSVGYTLNCGGVEVPAGMSNDPEYPLPDNAITAVRVRDVVLCEMEETR